MGVNARNALRKAAPIVCALLALACMPFDAGAQTVEARVSNVRGNVVRIHQARKFTLKRGDTLSPGEEVDTRGGGRAVIEMTDGSLITVLPNSHVVFKDYRTAGSLRELFHVLLGRVRVKISHYGGRPNPYRVNSPTASILVRGTDFGVIVAPSGETRVVVYEGLVEVESLADPNQRALVSPGQAVLVRFNQDIRFFTPGPGSDVGDRGGRTEDSDKPPAKPRAGGGRKNPSPIRNFVAGDYERYIDSLVEPGETPVVLRFIAFPDAHLDSLENPSYAAEFTGLEGRATVISSRSNPPGNINAQLHALPNPIEPVNSGYLMQGTFFASLPHTRLVVGGGATLSNSRLKSFSTAEFNGSPTPSFPAGIPGIRTNSSATSADSTTASLLLARRLGSEERTAVGIGLEYISGRGSLVGKTVLSNNAGPQANQKIEAQSDIDRTSFRIGLTHRFRGRHKLGLFYRHGFLSARDRDLSRTFNGMPLSLDSAQYNGQSSEIGLRMRGPLAPKWFYGIESLWLTTGLEETIHQAIRVDATERERISRGAVSFGIGHLLGPRTVLSADLAAGISRVKETYYEMATGNRLEDERQRVRFLSFQLGAQTDLWRNLFANVSLFGLAQSHTTDTRLYPDRFGRLLNNEGVFVPNGRARLGFSDTYADFGAGWRLSRGLLAEYVFTYSSGQYAPSHIILLRYTFSRE